MADSSSENIRHLDVPEQAIDLHLIKLRREGDRFVAEGRLKLSDIDNGKPIVILTWVSAHGPCLVSLPQYEMLYELAEEVETVNFIPLDYNPDVRRSEDPKILLKNLGEYQPSLPIYILDPKAPEDLHPKRQYEIFSAPEFIVIDSNTGKTKEHFVLIERESYRRAMSIILHAKSLHAV